MKSVRFDPTFNIGHIITFVSLIAFFTGVHYQVKHLLKNDTKQDTAILALTKAVDGLIAIENERIRSGIYHNHPH